MRCIEIERPGGWEALRLVERPDPLPAAGEVRIRVQACGVNYADGIIRMGLYASARELHGYPITPGFEVAGVIDAVGVGVTGLREGDAVLALTLFGGYSDCCVLPADQVFPIPPGLNTTQAAALPCAFLTAWFLALHLLRPRAADRWLVHSAAGGVGSALVQIGHTLDCEVIGVIGAAHKRGYLNDLGLRTIIDAGSEPLWPAVERAAPNGFHAVFDANGVKTLRQSYRHLAPTGRLVVYGFHSMLPHDGRLRWWKLAWDWLRTPRFNPLEMTQSNRSVVAANLSFLQSESALLLEGMRWLLQRFESGQLRPPQIETWPLEQAVKAQQRIESGQTVGKLVLLT